MREIKFRAWDYDNECMYDDSQIVIHNGTVFIGRIKFVNQISQDTELMQFTGLLDKRGKEIYEGDICKVINYASDYLKIQGKMYCVISWSNTTGFYGKGFGIPTTFSIGEEFEIIGNIYENPELLKDK